MRTHKIIPATSVLTIVQLEALSLSKEQAFANLNETFDYSLPQDWLNYFADWCSMSKHGFSHNFHVAYDLIRSTTVWAYLKSEPVTCCAEVYLAYQRYSKVED